MALKLGKCRLCLKLGDFYSIFTIDNALQLAEMVMECAKVKIYEGDGLPDKICSECVQKLSSAYIFKQQCERSDQELRRNYVPPPGFSVTPPPANRQSSDSAFSSVHTNVSGNKPSSSNDEKITPPRRNRKRSRDSIGDTSVSSRSHDFKPISAKRVDELKVSSQKKPRLQSPTTSFNDDSDADYEDNSYSHFSGDTDSDEPLLPNDAKCKICQKQCTTARYLKIHMKRVHPNANTESLGQDILVDIPKKPVDVPKKTTDDAKDDEEKLGCDKCGKTFKLKIMLKRHGENCEKQQPQVSPKKELLISLEPIDAMPSNSVDCEICTAKFKCFANLEKHMRVVHAAVPKKRVSQPAADPKISVPCIFCAETFDDFYIHGAHFSACSKKKDLSAFVCPVCSRELSRKSSYFTHLKHFHFEPRGVNAQVMKAQVKAPAPEETGPTFDCRVCSKKLPSQESLISHLEAHMSVKDSSNADITLDEDSRPDSIDDSVSVHSEYGNAQVNAGPYKCSQCDKRFKYRKALETHESKHTEVEIKVEPPDKSVSTSFLEESYEPDPEPESESSQEEGDDNTCDICEKQFSYKRLLIHHKRTKHNMSSGTKRAKINLKDCSVRCLICDVEMRVSAINEHNQKHITKNIKPRNLYTCAECSAKFKSCSALANHIKLIHRLKQPPMPMTFEGADLADFCEVVVTKAEPLDEIQSHNGFGEVPEKMEGEQTAFTCPICSKKMKTLISLKRHVNWHTNVGDNIQKTVECFVCKETFRFQSHYRLHMREHYHDTNLDPKFLTCTICNRKSKHLRAAQAHMNYHKQTRFKNKDYQCSICKRIFQHRKVYLSHMAIHYKRGESVMNTVVGDITPNNADKTIFDGKFTCQLCGKVCDSENSLKCHTSWHKSKTMLFGARHECYVCNTMFTNKRRLDIHVRSHYEDENGPYKCTICGKGYIDEEYFRRHVKGHNFDHQSHKKRIEKLRKDKVKCPICNRFYPDLVKLIRHLRRTHPESKMIKEDPDAPPPIYFSCKLCARVFLDERRLQAHEEAHLRKPEFFKCKFCGKKTISLKNHHVHIKGHLTQKYIDNPLKCTNCDEHFIRGYDLHYHLRDVHGITETWIAERSENALAGPLKELQCSVCLKVLASRGNFERHIDYHNSLRCNYCFDYFSSLRFLEGHLTFSCEKKNLIGDTEVFPKRVKCHLCYKAFHVQVKLDCHLRTQHKIQVSREASEGKQEIVCDYCFRVFENQYALTTHKVYHRTVGYFGCIYCNRKFNTLTLYRKHKNHHFAQLNVDNPTKCEHCDETFVAFREMIYHMRDVHNDEKEWIILPKDSIEETCHICNKTFFNLHRHLEYHEQNRCKKCAEYFYSMLDFDNHLCAIESDEENVSIRENSLLPAYEECVFCFKPVTRKQSKKLHDNLHKTSGSISCRFCPLKFKTIDAFNIHAFSHRSRKYNKKPIKCRKCGEKFVKYGPFMRHMKVVHKSKQKVHYRAVVKPERCVVCGDYFPNLHNHYRAHLQNQCQLCKKYFTSSRLFSRHECDKEDADPSKVFISDENLHVLINSYIPKDDKDDEKYYGYTEAEDEEEEVTDIVPEMPTKAPIKTYSKKARRIPEKLPEVNSAEPKANGSSVDHDDESQSSMDQTLLQEVHYMATSPIISDVLSLYQKNGTDNDDVVNLTDDDSLDMNDTVPVVIEIDD